RESVDSRAAQQTPAACALRRSARGASVRGRRWSVHTRATCSARAARVPDPSTGRDERLDEQQQQCEQRKWPPRLCAEAVSKYGIGPVVRIRYGRNRGTIDPASQL